MRHAFARYEGSDVRSALLATTDLFRWLAVETAERLGHPYPAAIDHAITGWVTECLSGAVD